MQQEFEYKARLVAEQLKAAGGDLPAYVKPAASPILDGMAALSRLLVEFGRELDGRERGQ